MKGHDCMNDNDDNMEIGDVVYFSSASNNTARFIESCHFNEIGITTHRLPLRANDDEIHVNKPYVLITPTYGGGEFKNAVPKQVKKFLNDPDNRKNIRGVIASGNANFGEAFCAAGDIISRKCNVPFMYYFELSGTQTDVDKVRNGLQEFFRNLNNKTNPTQDDETRK